ncbi:MAG TPA: autotransporter-associated beta strand repeat-containing protein, partial [Tepidisphaeraceae bacterium]|nr:autotransporter-associated beta strand repeat-containing protein [Tepidisphaeraceae bacterium]
VASGTEGLTLGSITMSGNGVLDVVDGASASTLVTVTGVVGGAFTLTKTGSGDMALNTVNTYSGDTTVSGGSLTIASAGSIASANVTVSAGATLSINGSLASSVAISDSGVVNFAGNPGTSAFTRAVGTLNVQHGGSAVALDSAFAMQAGVSQITTLTFADTTAKLDLRNNELIVNNALPAVRTQIILGEIFTTTAGGVIGYKDLGSGQTEARYALRGDANLDGTVDVSDLGALATSYGNSTGQLWVQGDFNNDGSVDVADLGALASSYGVSLASGLQAARLITAAAAATVASPASAASAIPRTALSNDAVRTTSYWIAGASPFGQNDRTVAWIFGDSRRDKLRPN